MFIWMLIIKELIKYMRYIKRKRTIPIIQEGVASNFVSYMLCEICLYIMIIETNVDYILWSQSKFNSFLCQQVFHKFHFL